MYARPCRRHPSSNDAGWRPTISIRRRPNAAGARGSQPQRPEIEHRTPEWRPRGKGQTAFLPLSVECVLPRPYGRKPAQTRGFLMRPSGRAPDQMRELTFEPGFTRHAEGSFLVSFGDTRVLCTASVEERVPPFLRGKAQGWVTAEYGMLPRATHTRGNREAAKGKQSGRTQEIQRLIGRSLRAVVDLPKLGERQVVVDCDVIQADGGTRTAAISGGWVALRIAIDKILEKKAISVDPIRTQVAAVSCGIHNG